MDFNFNPEDEAFRMEFRAVARRQQAVRAEYGRDHYWNGRGPRRIRQAEGMGEEDGRGPVARAELAQAIRRTRRGNFAEYRLWRGARARRRHGADDRDGYQPVRADAVALGDRRAEAALHPADHEGRRSLVPGLFRARLRLRPRVAADARGRGRRLLRRQRAEGVDLDRAARRLDLSAGAHRSRRAQA